MSIVQTATTSFKVQLAQGVHNFGPTSPNTFKIALFTAAATLNASITAYNSGLVGEVTGTGYSAGGIPLVITTTPTSGATGGTVAYWTFANAVWSPASFTCRGALIYNQTQNNASVAILDFGGDKTCANSFTIQFPTPTATTAILRIAQEQTMWTIIDTTQTPTWTIIGDAQTPAWQIING